MPEHDGSSTGAGGRPRDVRERQCKLHHAGPKALKRIAAPKSPWMRLYTIRVLPQPGQLTLNSALVGQTGNDPTRCGGVTPGDEGAQRNCRERNCRWRLQCGES